MMHTYRCLDCGEVLAAFATFEGRLPLLISQQAIQSQVQASKELHADRCPQARGARKAPRPEPPPLPVREPARVRALGWVWRRSEAGG
jgi:hypothetical protein